MPTRWDGGVRPSWSKANFFNCFVVEPFPNYCIILILSSVGILYCHTSPPPPPPHTLKCQPSCGGGRGKSIPRRNPQFQCDFVLDSDRSTFAACLVSSVISVFVFSDTTGSSGAVRMNGLKPGDWVCEGCKEVT